MSIFDRLQLLIRSEIQPRSRRGGERPASAEEARGVLRDVRDSLARLYAAESQVMASYQDQLDEVQAWEDRAALAVRAGNDGLAREALQRKRGIEQRAEANRRELDRIQREIVQLRDGVERLRAKAAPQPTASAPPPHAWGRHEAVARPTWGPASAAPPSVASTSTSSPAASAPAPPPAAPVSPWTSSPGPVRSANPWTSAAPPAAATAPAGAAPRAAASEAPFESIGTPTPTPWRAAPAYPPAPSSEGLAPDPTVVRRPSSTARASEAIDEARRLASDGFQRMASRVHALEAEVEARSLLEDDLDDPLHDPHAASFRVLEEDARRRGIERDVEALRQRASDEPAGDSGGEGDDPLERLRRRLGGG